VAGLSLLSFLSALLVSRLLLASIGSNDALALVIFFHHATFTGCDGGLFAQFTASAFIGSILSHLMQRSSVRPFLITGIRRLKHFGQRLLSIILASRFRTNGEGTSGSIAN
jgi:hypothetical protein